MGTPSPPSKPILVPVLPSDLYDSASSLPRADLAFLRGQVRSELVAHGGELSRRDEVVGEIGRRLGPSVSHLSDGIGGTYGYHVRLNIIQVPEGLKNGGTEVKELRGEVMVSVRCIDDLELDAGQGEVSGPNSRLGRYPLDTSFGHECGMKISRRSLTLLFEWSDECYERDGRFDSVEIKRKPSEERSTA